MITFIPLSRGMRMVVNFNRAARIDPCRCNAMQHVVDALKTGRAAIPYLEGCSKCRASRTSGHHLLHHEFVCNSQAVQIRVTVLARHSLIHHILEELLTPASYEVVACEARKC